MKLKQEILEKIRADRNLRNRLMCDLPISHGTLYSVLKENKENNVLTKSNALDIISAGLKIKNKKSLIEMTF